MKKSWLLLAALMIVFGVTVNASAQGRGRGNGRGRDQSWKCNVFVNCHDASEGRLDGRGPNRTTFYRNRTFARGNTVGYRRRYDMNDYWRRRHLDYNYRGRYRSRMLRNR